MSPTGRLNYYRRILSAYLLSSQSQLTFWHELPEVNLNASRSELGEYYMLFTAKADYSGHRDGNGIPMLDYHGAIGRQYNPIAIAQWGLANYNLFRRSGNEDRKTKFLAASNWLCAHLEQNPSGIWVWNHHFDWEYRTPLRSPWYSGLAQGQGISLLLRTHRETGDASYLEAAQKAFASFTKSTSDGGVTFTDERGDLWIEEYMVSPPTHILNGFMWAIWGVHDYFLATGDTFARTVCEASVRTLLNNLARYDLGFWSLYELSGTWLPMVASPFYHQLHIVQLRVMHLLTGEALFLRYAERWESYRRSRTKRTRALCYKGVFKICHY
jgi:heparosan-N-sulfate-glucuronate 5-epimerase